MLSLEPEYKIVALVDKTQQFTIFLCPSKFSNIRPDLKSQYFKVVSAEPETKISPSRDKTQQVTDFL